MKENQPYLEVCTDITCGTVNKNLFEKTKSAAQNLEVREGECVLDCLFAPNIRLKQGDEIVKKYRYVERTSMGGETVDEVTRDAETLEGR